MKRAGANPAGPVLVADLLPEERASLLELLRSLEPDRWEGPTACPGWSVKDIALHLLGDDIGILSRRKGEQPSGAGDAIPSPGWDELVTEVNRSNQLWVEATRRLSPQLICDFLKVTGRWTQEYFSSLEPGEPGEPVSWAAPGPAPAWLGIAREYTERWTHQQQIREAVGKQGLRERRFFAPVLSTFMWALPRTYRDTEAPEGTVIEVGVDGEAGGTWSLKREKSAWALFEGSLRDPALRAALDQNDAWRLFTRSLPPDLARGAISLKGDQALAVPLYEAVAILA